MRDKFASARNKTYLNLEVINDLDEINWRQKNNSKIFERNKEYSLKKETSIVKNWK